MPKQMIRIHEVQSGEITDREMTADEIAELTAATRALADLAAATAAKVSSKQAVLDKLGLTADELAAALS